MNKNNHPLRKSQITISNKVKRAIWQLCWLTLFRPSPTILHGWRRFLLRSFGAKIGPGAHPYPSARIWAPWNLEMGEKSCLSHYVDCYCVDRVTLGKRVTVSQYSYLCTASRDYEDSKMPLVSAPITIGDDAWVTADVFIGPGVTIGDGAVIGARSSVFASVTPWTIAVGNPAISIKPRNLKAL